MKLFFYCWFIICLAYGLAISSFESVAQISEKGIPESFQLNQKSATIIPVLKLDSVHVQRMIEEDKKFSIDNRYGVVQQCDISIKEVGVKTEIQGKGTIWQYKIESNDAYSLGLFFKKYHLPRKSKVFVYDSSRTNLIGAFTQKNNNAGNQLPIAEFPGKNLIIEYFEPFSSEFSGELILGSISQAYTDFKSAAIDRIGINCPEGNNWQVQKNCVCLMSFHDSQYSYYCTGALLNNLKEDLTPYFLTANHCVRTETMANTMVTYFGYENSSCMSHDASNNQTLSGATFKSGSTHSDFSLLILNENPPDEYNPYFAGWDARGNAPSSGVSIHHPDGDPKCIAIDTIPLSSYPEKVQWTYDGGRLSSTTFPDTHWDVQFTKGIPEMGSSGSPLFDQNKRIVGQLHGGANFVLLYGKFSLSWDYNPSHSEQLAHWLDPDSICTTKVFNGIWKIPPKAKFRAERRDVCPNTPVLFYDETTQKPIKWHWKVEPFAYSFANGTDSTSQNPQIKFLDQGYYTVTLYSTNKYGSDTLTQKNYIFAEKKLEVKLLQANKDNLVCGCDLKSFPILANGAVSYKFSVDKKEFIDTKYISNTLYLTLNAAANITKSFDTWVKVDGTNGLCNALDSMLLHVIVQPNDNIANAARLYLGRNSGYSNKCATIEKYEPNPSSTGCQVENNWCPDLYSYSVLNNSIWFTFVSPPSGWVTINTNGFDDQIALYQSLTSGPLLLSSKSPLGLIAANDNRSISDNAASITNVALVPGKQYWLQVDGNNSAYGDLVIDLISNSLEVFPNPSSGIFKIIIANTGSGIADVIISDLNGQKLFTNKYGVNINTNKFDIDLSGYPKGIYLLNVYLNGSVHSKKLVLF